MVPIACRRDAWSSSSRKCAFCLPSDELLLSCAPDRILCTIRYWLHHNAARSLAVEKSYNLQNLLSFSQSAIQFARERLAFPDFSCGVVNHGRTACSSFCSGASAKIYRNWRRWGEGRCGGASNRHRTIRRDRGGYGTICLLQENAAQNTCWHDPFADSKGMQMLFLTFHYLQGVGGANCAYALTCALRRLHDDAYLTLGIPVNGADADVKRAYRKLALRFHPDKNRATSSLFQAIQGAYDVLSDPEKRPAYDEKRRRQQAALAKLRKQHPHRQPQPHRQAGTSSQQESSPQGADPCTKANNAKPSTSFQRHQSPAENSQEKMREFNKRSRQLAMYMTTE